MSNLQKEIEKCITSCSKSEKCTTKISLEEKEQLKERSDQIRRDRNRIAMLKRREKLRAENHEKLKEDQNKWKYDERKWRIDNELNKEINNEYKQKSREKAKKGNYLKVREDQNKWQKKSRAKKRREYLEYLWSDRKRNPTGRDFEKMKKQMKKSAETTAKWRENERKKDPEVFKARQQFWASRMFKSYGRKKSKLLRKHLCHFDNVEFRYK